MGWLTFTARFSSPLLQAMRRPPVSASGLDPPFDREALHPGYCISQAPFIRSKLPIYLKDVAKQVKESGNFDVFTY